MKPYIDMCIDLETKGKDPDGVIASIGVVAFDAHHSLATGTFEVLGTYYTAVDQESCAAVGMTYDEDTIEWWKGEHIDQRAKDALLVDPMPIDRMLDELCAFYTKLGDIRHIYGYSPSFDLTIVESAYKYCGKKEDIPWVHWQEQDARTIAVIAEYMRVAENPSWPAEGVVHHAYWDAYAEAWAVSLAYKRLDYFLSLEEIF